MAKNAVTDWDATAGNNTDIGGINIAEGCPPSGINNAIREEMAQITAARNDGTILGSGAMAGHVYGLTLANGSDADHDIDISIGSAASDETAPVNMSLTSAITKQLDVTWAVGTNAGGLDTGSIAADTWYYLWLIERSDTGVVDALFSTSATSPTMPTNYDRKRRIGAVLTDSSSNIYGFYQVGDYFQWTSAHNDIATSSLGTSATTYPISSPLGIRCIADVEGIITNVSGQASVWISGPQEADAVPGVTQPTTATLATGANDFATFQKMILTDTSSQIRARSNVALTTLRLRTAGYFDTRGRYE